MCAKLAEFACERFGSSARSEVGIRAPACYGPDQADCAPPAAPCRLETTSARRRRRSRSRCASEARTLPTKASSQPRRSPLAQFDASNRAEKKEFDDYDSSKV